MTQGRIGVYGALGTVKMRSACIAIKLPGGGLPSTLGKGSQGEFILGSGGWAPQAGQ